MWHGGRTGSNSGRTISGSAAADPQCASVQRKEGAGRSASGICCQQLGKPTAGPLDCTTSRSPKKEFNEIAETLGKPQRFTHLRPATGPSSSSVQPYDYSLRPSKHNVPSLAITPPSPKPRHFAFIHVTLPPRVHPSTPYDLRRAPPTEVWDPPTPEYRSPGLARGPKPGTFAPHRVQEAHTSRRWPQVRPRPLAPGLRSERRHTPSKAA
jgi:hypothetical protein